MAWIVVDLHDTLLTEAPPMPDPMTGEETGGGPMAVPGAPEAVAQLLNEGHRVTVYTSLFAPMPESKRYDLRQQVEQMLQGLGFPEVEVWTGTTKPDGDLFIGANHITFDNDWGLALAQMQQMMEDLGLLPGPQPGATEMGMAGEEEPAPTAEAGFASALQEDDDEGGSSYEDEPRPAPKKSEPKKPEGKKSEKRP